MKAQVPEVIMFWTEFLDWLMTTTDRFPKKSRQTLVNRINNLALDLVEHLVEARYGNSVISLKAANLCLDKLRLMIRICHSRRYLANNQYEFASRHIDETGRMIGGWQKKAIQ